MGWFSKRLKKAFTPSKKAKRDWNKYIKPAGRKLIPASSDVSQWWNKEVKPIGSTARSAWNKKWYPSN